jgi:L-fucose isomerase-like protein
MTNVQILAKVILDIEMVVAEQLEPGHPQEAKRLVDQILEIMDEAKAVEVAERVQLGFTGPRLVK